MTNLLNTPILYYFYHFRHLTNSTEDNSFLSISHLINSSMHHQQTLIQIDE